MRFPDGSEVEGPALPTGEPFMLRYHTGPVEVRPVAGDWTSRLCELAGYDVQLVRPGGVGETLDAPVTLVSTASVARLEREAGRPVDARRFRMLFDLEGCEPHEEDEWAGRPVRIGGAVVRPTLAVERCAVTTRDPETGRRDLDTLRLIRGYREPRGDVEIPFGMLAEVEAPGRVRVGDPVEPL
jgi:MOSC domain-containing protein